MIEPDSPHRIELSISRSNSLPYATPVTPSRGPLDCQTRIYPSHTTDIDIDGIGRSNTLTTMSMEENQHTHASLSCRIYLSLPSHFLQRCSCILTRVYMFVSLSSIHMMTLILMSHLWSNPFTTKRLDQVESVSYLILIGVSHRIASHRLALLIAIHICGSK